MFLRSIRVEMVDNQAQASACALAHLDSFCMRNFTNDAVFDDTLPIADGLIQIGNLVPLTSLHENMQAWFRRKLYLRPEQTLRLTEVTNTLPGYSS